MKLTKKQVFLSLFFVGLSFCLIKAVRAEEIQSPIVLETAQIRSSSGTQIMVKGLIAKQNEENQILIYVNGIYNGFANISQGNNEFSHFNYLSSPLVSSNSFNIFAIAKNKESRILSAPTNNIVDTIIEEGLLISTSISTSTETIVKTAVVTPAPVLLIPKQNFCESDLHISGLAQNRSLVKVFINDKLYDKFFVFSKTSSTAFFEYSPTVKMDRGQYSVYATAEDDQNNKSAKSNILKFCISTPQTISTSTEINELNSSSNPQQENVATNTVFQKTIENKQVLGEKIKKTNNNVNIILFIGFIVAIIFWIFLVNKELLEENKESSENEKDKK
jgi:hypothetical protein